MKKIKTKTITIKELSLRVAIRKARKEINKQLSKLEDKLLDNEKDDTYFRAKGQAWDQD